MSNERPPHEQELTRTRRLFEWISRRIKPITIVVLALTVVVVPVAASADQEEPDFAPRGEIYDTFDLVVEERFESSSPVVRTSFLVQGQDGRDFVVGGDGVTDVLTADALLEWKTNSDALRADEPTLTDDDDPHLADQFDIDLGVQIDGVYSIADAVDQQLPGGLTEDTTDAEVKQALHELLAEDAPTAALRGQLSQLASQELDPEREITVWKSPGFRADVVYDFESFEISDPDDPDEQAVDLQYSLEGERWLREVQDVLQGDEQNYTALGVAIDGELTAEEGLGESAPFILLAVVLIVLLMGALLRSYWAAALVISGLTVTMIFFRATTTLLGFKGGLLLGFMIPIAVISFGVDFFVHASGRTREEQVLGASRERAYPLGLTAIAAALTLAVLSSIAAFLSNTASGVQAIIQFGLGAAIALAWAYLFLGLLVPKLLLATESTLGRPPVEEGFLRLGRRLGFFLMVLVGGAAVTFSVVLPFLGAATLAVFLLLFVALPLRVAKRSYARSAAEGKPTRDEVRGFGQGVKAAGSAVHFLARWRVVTVPVVAVLAVLGGVAFTAVDSEFSFSDFFAEDTDFIVSLDRLEDHYPASAGQTSFVYLEGDLADPDALAAIEAATTALDEANEAGAPDRFLAREAGELVVEPNAVAVVRAATASSTAREAVEAETGVEIVDRGDGLPEDAEQVAAIYEYARVNGVPSDLGVQVFPPGRVEAIVDEVGEDWATLIEVGVNTLTEDAIILDARAALEDAADGIETGPAGDSFRVVAVSGDSVIGQDNLDQFTTAMLISLPIAVILCGLIASLFMRSARYGAVAVIPILLVVGWVYGFMWAVDYTINVITATIAAIAVGVGIDYSTHFTMRFREEFEFEPSRFPALRRAGEGTGGALAISAASSIIGFLAMSLAPMSIFTTFGILTAVMIFFSLLVSLLVLPSLLLLVTRSRVGPERERLEETVTHGEWEYKPHARTTARRGISAET